MGCGTVGGWTGRKIKPGVKKKKKKCVSVTYTVHETKNCVSVTYTAHETKHTGSKMPALLNE